MKFKFELGDLIKIPNILCYLRILMVPLFLHIYFTAERPQDFYLATLVVMLSGLTDFFDGQIARECNIITDLGRIIDPLADEAYAACNACCTYCKSKIYVPFGYISCFERGNISSYRFFCDEICKKRLNGAKWYGKVCTAILYVVMLALVAFPQMEVHVQDILTSCMCQEHLCLHL